MYDLTFSNSDMGDGYIVIGHAKTEEEAEKKLMDSFVRFCRDIAKKPLDRDHYSNGFSWNFKGKTYYLFYKEKQDNDGESN